MKIFYAVAVALFVVVASVWAAGEKDKTSAATSTSTEGDIKIYKRLIPADVLRGK